MLSSDDKRFRWAKDDRTEEPTLFRQMIQKWQPQVKQLRRPGLVAVARVERPQHKSVWSPWLWVKK